MSHRTNPLTIHCCGGLPMERLDLSVTNCVAHQCVHLTVTRLLEDGLNDSPTIVSSGSWELGPFDTVENLLDLLGDAIVAHGIPGYSPAVPGSRLIV